MLVNDCVIISFNIKQIISVIIYNMHVSSNDAQEIH